MDKSLKNFDKCTLQQHLSNWYQLNCRDLPWRKTNDPYCIWVSEVMLQQTKVDTVIDYYNKFIAFYPTIFHLARADEQEVLKMWEGLGYYSRARNLHFAAQTIVNDYEGKIPAHPELLGQLKGVGPYTKGAIASIAFGLPEPAVDGNVMRVLSRVLRIRDNIGEQKTKRRFEKIVMELLIGADPSIFNQGLMELGALICTPKNPTCGICPINEICRAYENGEENQLPLKMKKKKPRTEQYILLLIKDEHGRIAIEKRPEQGLLANLWQFPMLEKRFLEKGMANQLLEKRYQTNISILERRGNVKHVFSHIIWELDIFHATCHSGEKAKLTFKNRSELTNYPFSVSHLKAMDYL